jgi:hypothetical protein
MSEKGPTQRSTASTGAFNAAKDIQHNPQQLQQDHSMRPSHNEEHDHSMRPSHQ